MSAIPGNTRLLARRIVLVALGALLMSMLVSCGGLRESTDSSWSGTSSPEYGVPQESSDGRDMIQLDIAPPPDLGAGPDASTVPPDERLVIRTLGMRVQVDEVEPAIESLRDAVDAVDGMITTVQVTTDDSPVYRYEASGTFADGTPLKGYLTARIPPANVDRFIDSVSDLGKILRQAEDESDVTQEHVDLSARLDNLRVQEERLRELFERAEEVEDMLAIERELARVRGEIESYEARIAYLERQAAMATVTVELVGREPIIAPSGEDWGFVEAVRAGVRGFVNTINGLIFIALSALPLLILAVVATFVVRAIVRRRRGHAINRTTEETAPPSPAPDDTPETR